MTTAFDYSQTGLPSNPHWMLATDLCHQWLGEHMTMFGPKRHIDFMFNQPAGAAKRVFDNCDQFTPECITVLLLGPAKGTLIETTGAERMARHLFGDRVVDLIQALHDPAAQAKADPVMLRDIGRIVLAEGISTMNDQLIGRDAIELKSRAAFAGNPDRMRMLDHQHQVRWSLLTHLEEQAALLRGVDPKLDDLVRDAARHGRSALETIDKALGVARPQQPPRP